MPRWLWAVSPAILLGTAFAVLTRFVRQGPALPREISVDRAVTARTPANLIDLSHAVDVQNWVLVVLALVVCLLLARRYRQALLLLAAEPLAEALNLALKIVINRQFPDQALVPGWDRLGTLLFPSGHVVRTTVTLGLLVVFVAWPNARWRWPATFAALGFVGLVSVTQVAVGGHLPLDVVGGFLLGGLLVNLVYLVERTWARWLARRLEPLRRSGVVVIEVGRQARQPGLPRALPAPAIRSWRAMPALGLAVAVVIVALGLGAPQRIWHRAAESTSAAAWPRALVAAAEQRAGSAREWVARVHVAVRGSS